MGDQEEGEVEGEAVGGCGGQALVPVRPGSEHREMWRVIHGKVVAVRAEPSNASTLLGTRRPGARVIVSCREGVWVLLHPDEGYGLQSAWMLADGAEMGLGILMQPDAGKLLQLTLEASASRKPTSAEVVVNVRTIGSGFNVDLKVPREAKVFEVKQALAEFVGQPAVLDVRLLRRKSDSVGFAARTSDSGYTSLNDGDDLGLLRQLFVIGVSLLPEPGSPAEHLAKEVLPPWMFRTEYRPLSLLDQPWEEEDPATGSAAGSSATLGSPGRGAGAAPAAAPAARPSTGPKLRARVPPHLRVFRADGLDFQ